MKSWPVRLLLLCLMGLMSGCGQQVEPEKVDHVKLQLKWMHQAQFVGFYVAKEEGYYKEENLEVTFLEGGPGISQIERIQNREADFAVVPAESLFLKNGHEEQVVGIAVIYQRNPTVFLVKPDSSIVHPKDFAHKTIAVGQLGEGGFLEAIVQLQAMMRNVGVGFDEIKAVDYDPKYRNFLEGRADVTPAYLTGGVARLKNEGVEVNTIWPGDYGVDTYSDTLATSKKIIQDHPQLIERFLRASLRGWRTAIENNDLALEATLKYAEIKDRDLQQDMLDAQIPLVVTGNTPIGWMVDETWRSMAELYGPLSEEEVLPVSEMHTTVFLEKVTHQPK